MVERRGSLHKTHLEEGLAHVNCSISFIITCVEGRQDLNQYVTVRMENRVEVRDFVMGEAALSCHKMKYKKIIKVL